jgi:hypothetical protein
MSEYFGGLTYSHVAFLTVVFAQYIVKVCFAEDKNIKINVFRMHFMPLVRYSLFFITQQRWALLESSIF